jgi:tRNA/tmRNA/rRNA uracil-C5-methylase (TrmA/RlmC/RlmD family)
MHLAPSAQRVTAVESHGESARLAEHNIALNNTAHTTVVAQDVTEFLSQQAGDHFDVVVADPPRTGMGDKACAELLRLVPRRMVYISCNSLTQLADIHQLSPAYRLTLLRGYDMFPHTPHVEMLAVLDARSP